MSVLRQVRYPLLAIALIMVVLALWWMPCIVKGTTPFSEWGYGLIWGDWLSDHRFLVQEESIPEWNPNNVLGVNYVGRDSFNNPLSLGNLFKFCFSNPKTEWLFGVFFYLAIMGVGTYFFLRSQGISCGASLLGAVLICLYPKWTDDIYHGPGKFVTGYSMVPWALLIITQMFKTRPRLLHFVGLGVLGGIIFLGSGAWVCVVVSYFLIPYFLYRFMAHLTGMKSGRSRALVGTVVGTLLALLIALGLSSYLLFPIWDNIHLSGRSLYSAGAGYDWNDFRGLIFPWHTRIHTMGYFDLPVRLPFGLGNAGNYRFYFGILALPLLFYVLGRAELRRKYRYFWIWPLVVMLLFSRIGMRFFPVVDIFEKSLGAQPSENFQFFGIIFCLNLLVAAALDSLSERCRTRGKPGQDASSVPEGTSSRSDREMQTGRPAPPMLPALTRMLTTALLILYGMVFILWVTVRLLLFYWPAFGNAIVATSFCHKLKHYAGIQLAAWSYFHDYFFYLILAVFALRFLVLWGLRSLRAFKSSRTFAALGCLMVAEFLLIPHILMPFTSSLDLRYSPVLEQNAFVANEVGPAERVASHHPNVKINRKIDQFMELVKNEHGDNRVWNPREICEDFNRTNPDLGYYEPLFDIGVSYFPATIGRQIYNYHESLLPEYFYDFDKAMNGGNPGYTRQSWNAVWDPHSPLIDIAGIKYLFWYVPLQDSRLRLVGEYDVGKGYIYENIRAVPKAYLVSGVEHFEKRDELLRRMQEASFDPFKTATTEDNDLAALPFPDAPAAGPDAGQVRVEKYTANEIVIDTQASGRSVLVVTDLFFPYWTADVDGRPTRIYRVNCVFRGIVVEGGKHKVVMRYRNTAFHTGVKVSFVFVVVTGLLAVAGLLSWRRGRKQEPCEPPQEARGEIRG